MIETQRLILRRPTLADAPAMQDIKQANWPELQKWMVWAADDQLSMDATKSFITDFVENDFKNGGCILFAFHKETNDLVMVGGFNATDTQHVYSTGYWGNIDYLSQGYATEMTRAIIDYAFTQHAAEKILISYFEGNEKSKRIIEKCGFDFLEKKEKYHKSFATSEMMDEYCYVLTKNNWKQQKP